MDFLTHFQGIGDFFLPFFEVLKGFLADIQVIFLRFIRSLETFYLLRILGKVDFRKVYEDFWSTHLSMPFRLGKLMYLSRKNDSSDLLYTCKNTG